MAKKKTPKRSSAPKRPSDALLNMLPPKLRAGFLELERERDDENVSEDQWEKNAMKLMHEADSMPAPIRDAFGQAVKKIAAIERYTDRREAQALKDQEAKAASAVKV